MVRPTYYCPICGRELYPHVEVKDQSKHIVYFCPDPLHGKIDNPLSRKPQLPPEGASLIREDKPKPQDRGGGFPPYQRDPGRGRLLEGSSIGRNAQIPAPRTGGMAKAAAPVYVKCPKCGTRYASGGYNGKCPACSAPEPGAPRRGATPPRIVREVPFGVSHTAWPRAIMASVTHAIEKRSKKFIGLMTVPIIGIILSFTLLNFIGGLWLCFILLAVYNFVPEERDLTGTAKLEYNAKRLEVLTRELAVFTQLGQAGDADSLRRVKEIKNEIMEIEAETRDIEEELGLR